MAALRSLSDNSNIVVNMVLTSVDSFFIHFEMLALSMISVFLLKRGHFHVLSVSGSIIFKFAVLVGFLSCSSGRGGAQQGKTLFYYCQMEIEVLIFHWLLLTPEVGGDSLLLLGGDGDSSSLLVSTDPAVEIALLLLGGGESAASPLDLL